MAKPQCRNHEILKSIESSLDRLGEAKWFIQMMEKNYHQADQFRWSLNSFLRALKEVLQLLTMETQRNKELSKWLRTEKARLAKDQIISLLFKQRDVVVHKSMLKPASKGMVGFTRGNGLKIGLGVPINPLEDSETAILKYIFHVAESGKDFLGILYTEDDGSYEYTCVQREWRLQQFPDDEIIRLIAKAWEEVAKVTLEAARRLGAEVIDPTLNLGDPNEVQFEIYAPAWVKAQLDSAKEYLAENT